MRTIIIMTYRYRSIRILRKTFEDRFI